MAKRKAVPGRQAYVPFTPDENQRIDAYLEREGRKKGWLIRRATLDFLDREEAGAK